MSISGSRTSTRRATPAQIKAGNTIIQKGEIFPEKKRGKDLTDFSYLSKMEAAAIFLSAGCGNSLHLSLDN